MTAASTVLSMGFLPLNIYIYSHLTYPQDVLGALNWISLGISLAVVVSSIMAGLAVSHRYSSRPPSNGDDDNDGDDEANNNKGQRVRSIINKFGNLAGLGLILFTSLASEGGRITLPGKEPVFYYGTILPIAFGLVCSVIVASLVRLKRPERVTVAVECVYQNTAIAMTSALSLFPNPQDQKEAVAVPFWYTGMQTVFTGVFCLVAWQFNWTKAPRTDNPIKMLFNSYEVAEATVPPTPTAALDNDEDGDKNGCCSKNRLSDEEDDNQIERIQETQRQDESLVSNNTKNACDEEVAVSAELFDNTKGTSTDRRKGTEDTAASVEPTL